MVKVNGENAQVTYVGEIKAWLIASNKVSLLAKCADDLNHYKDRRFDFVYAVGMEWFRELDRL
jgi:hypothetical protein